MSKPTVFISYSHRDEQWKDRLVTHLGVLQRENLLGLWEDTRIGAGDYWYDEIQQAINAARIAILLVSADFLNSGFILREEVPRLLERREKEGLRVFPILVRHCAWKEVKWLSRMQLRPEGAEPLSAGDENQIDSNLAAIAEEVATIIGRTAPLTTGEEYIPPGPEKTSLARLPSTSPDLFGREEELKILDAAWNNSETNVIGLVAWGGVGKTALVNKWLLEVGKENYRGAERVYGWSFYTQGAAEGKQVSGEPFIDHALKWFGDPDPTEGSPWDKGERLAELVRNRRTLLVLDGLEPLQYPPGEMGGRLKDSGLQILLRMLARQNRGLCIVTTRLEIDDLKDFVGNTVDDIELEHLSLEAGVEYLSHLGVGGSPEELKQAVNEFEGHALALTLLGRYLSITYGGDIRQRDKIARLTEERKRGGQARRVMTSYEKWFDGKPELDILLILGLFDRPAVSGAIEALRAEPVIDGLTSELHGLSEEDWRYALRNLRAARLLAEEDPRDRDTLDCHPLVREHFGKRLNETNLEASKEAHSRLYNYYKSTAKEYPDTIEEMIPLYDAVHHGCKAGLHLQAYVEVYQERILRRNQGFSWRRLGAFGSDLVALSGFFEQPWTRPVDGLTDDFRAMLSSLVGFHLRSLGRLAEAAELMQAGLEAAISTENWKKAFSDANNLSELHLAKGDLDQAMKYAEQSSEFADLSGDNFRALISRTMLTDVLHQVGRIDEAEEAFPEAREMQKELDLKYSLFYSIQGFRYSDLLLGQGRYQEVLGQATETPSQAEQGGASALGIALGHLALGQAELIRAQKEKTGEFSQAEAELNKAVDGLRIAGMLQEIPRGLLVRAKLWRVTGEFEKARADLDQAMEVITRGHMKRFKADCHLELARLCLAEGEKDRAKENFSTAKEMIEEMGYRRRDNEVKELEEQLEDTP